jgi:DNA-binding transcriptional regulator YiaG
MSNIAAALRQEITRLARKEARSLTKPLHKATASFRKVIAELKRENARAHADIARFIRQMPVGVVPRVTESEPSKARFSAASVKAQRRRLGLSAEAFAKLIGVTAHTVYSWEHGSSRPRSAQVVAFAALRGIGKTEANARLEQLRVKVPKARKKAGRR